MDINKEIKEKNTEKSEDNNKIQPNEDAETKNINNKDIGNNNNDYDDYIGGCGF